MKRTLVFLALSLLTPAAALAAPASTFSGARSLLLASSSPANAYALGATVAITAPVAEDLSAVGGSVVLAAPAAGDALLMGGSVAERAPVRGDLRALGGKVSVSEPAGGDMVALGLSVQDAAPAGGSTFVAAANASVTGGADGPVTIYGNTVSIGGNFAGNVTVVAGTRLSVASSTIIAGALTYQAPEPAVISAGTVIKGGVHFSSASFMPSAGSRALALVSIGIFLLARILGALILAGLLAGLFPRLAEAVTDRAWTGSTRSVLLTMLLGFAAVVATPILLILLAITFIGIGIAFLLGIAYALLLVLSFIYAGILVGLLAARRIERRAHALWRDGVLGMLVLSLLALVPIVGAAVVFLIMLFSAGALLLLFFQLAFPHEEETADLLH